jgi:hypothetical protein
MSKEGSGNTSVCRFALMRSEQPRFLLLLQALVVLEVVRRGKYALNFRVQVIIKTEMIIVGINLESTSFFIKFPELLNF